MDLIIGETAALHDGDIGELVLDFSGSTGHVKTFSVDCLISTKTMHVMREVFHTSRFLGVLSFAFEDVSYSLGSLIRG